MPLLPRSLKWRVRLLTLLGLAAVGGSVWSVFGRKISFSVENQWAIFGLRDDPHPVTRGLARGEIGPHTPIEELIAAHPPDELIRSGRFVTASYYSDRGGTHVVAVDGRVAQARLCGSQYVYFFDHLTTDEFRAVGLMTLVNEPAWPESVRAGHRAVAGVAGYEGTCHWRPWHRPAVEDEPDPEGR